MPAMFAIARAAVCCFRLLPASCCCELSHPSMPDLVAGLRMQVNKGMNNVLKDEMTVPSQQHGPGLLPSRLRRLDPVPRCVRLEKGMLHACQVYVCWFVGEKVVGMWDVSCGEGRVDGVRAGEEDEC